MTEKIWKILNKSKPDNPEGIVDVLLKNRGIASPKQKKEFLNPINPYELKLSDLALDGPSVSKSIERIKKAIKKDEQILIYGDYDADGVCATAILWETLFTLSKKVTPYIPNRFSEGYGINAQSVEQLKLQNPGLNLIITVDNGIVAFDGIEKASELGIDVIVTDHHAKDSKLPAAFSIVHTTKLSGSGISWIFSREILRKLGDRNIVNGAGLELSAIGTVADQLQLTEANRSIVKYGLFELNSTKRPGLLALFENSGLVKFKNGNEVGTYEVNFVIAPRINAMGRMEHAIDSLRLICTKDIGRAQSLAKYLDETNKERQKTVQQVVNDSLDLAKKSKDSVLIISGKYHEGVIGLAAGKLVEEFYLPAIVISEGDDVSKASARSISGFDIIESIRKVGKLIVGGGGHPMAAGFSIKTANIPKFRKEFLKIAKKKLTKDILRKKLKIDLELRFEDLTFDLLAKISDLKPYGMGNPGPVFVTNNVEVVDVRKVGNDGKHLKLKLKKDNIYIDAIAFGFGGYLEKLSPEKKIDIAYSLEGNTWNGSTSIQLLVKDINPEV